MSKSMWIPTEGDNLPVKADSTTSCFVLFWVEGQRQPFWGYYSYANEVWHNLPYSNYSEPAEVKYFAYIDNPYK